ncbi:MAG: hypothetical protein KGJ55_06745, partial [Gammaproteobacteria bacterium]|nr:hypothetical protein [Gammaproteobacteria bacterium]
MTRPLRCALGLLLALSAPLTAASPVRTQVQDTPLHWRLLGPFRGGWATCATGIPTQPNTFLIGTAGGGVWKTEDAGRTWQPLTDGTGIVSVGALAVAPGDPQLIYVGTGQVAPRYDIASGDGVWKSVDGGKSWQHIGLTGTRHIGAIAVAADDPNVVTVAALGPLFASGAERGVFQSRDGGATWKQVLKIDADTGAVDLAVDPQRPRLMFAAAWQARDYPWLSYFHPIRGPGSGIYRSTDGGASWRPVPGHGLPPGPLGRIGLAVATAGGNTRLYATIDAAKDGGLYRSDDGGNHWRRLPAGGDLADWYFSRLTVAPDDPDTLYVMNRSIHRSTDGGEHLAIFKGAPGGDDYHFLWINPRHPDHLITASDQGAVVSVDGGASWSSWYNQPTGQFYHLATDDRFPFRIYSGQQDSGTVGIASRSDYGAISVRDWRPVGGDERDYDVPDPQDPDIVFGSGLGGRLSRWDARTGQVANVSPWPQSSYGAKPDTVRYRYTWITPLAFGRQPPYPLYFGAQVLFRSLDRGDHWQVISPDLSRARPGSKACDDAPNPRQAADCGFGVIYTIEPDPHDNRRIWIGTDDGRVQKTADGGAHWSDVTPPGLPRWARVDSISISAVDPQRVYVSADNHRQADDRPYAWRSADGGKTWSAIGAGLPQQQFVDVLRADPVTPGLLYAGGQNGVSVSFDDGAHWQSLQQNLPQAWVRDLLVKDDTLIAATQGRAIWALDDLGLLRQLPAADTAAPLMLTTPASAFRVHPDNNRDTPPPSEEPLGENPPAGAVIDYRVGTDVTQPLRLELRDMRGQPLRVWRSDVPPPTLPAQRYFAGSWVMPRSGLSATPGWHRLIWNLRGERPRALSYEYSIAAVAGKDTPLDPRGAWVLPGRYRLVLAAGDRNVQTWIDVVEDPRVNATRLQLGALWGFSLLVNRALDDSHDAAV